MSKVPELFVKAASLQLNRARRDLGYLLDNARRYQVEADDAARQARECLEEYDKATRQVKEATDWLKEHAPDQLEFL